MAHQVLNTMHRLQGGYSLPTDRHSGVPTFSHKLISLSTSLPIIFNVNTFLLLVGFLAQLSSTQWIVKQSEIIPGARLSYRKTTACNASVNMPSYSGYVRLTSSAPPDLQGSVPYNTSTFFWFFPARKSVGSNLALYLAGGPGEASTFTALTENGPCIAQKDGNSVKPNQWSLNENSHLLYVDQPNQVGFSYDQIIDGVFDAMEGLGSGRVFPGAGEQTSSTRIKGKFPTQLPETTASTSTMAAKNMWYFLQVFFAEFSVPYGEKDSVSIWGNSYGGMYTSSLASYILRTNYKLPQVAGTTYRRIKVPSVGITNGCLDLEAQASAYATYPYNNTYDDPKGKPLRLWSKAKADEILKTARAPGGCFEQMRACRKRKASDDPTDAGRNEAVNNICVQATSTCNIQLLYPFFATQNVSQYDILSNVADPNPPMWAASYLNKPRIRDNLGVTGGLNYTLYSYTVLNNFFNTGDPLRKGSDDLMYLLNQGTRVAMIYGDRDFRCNWIGGENLTLSLPWKPYSRGRFPSSGYVNLELPTCSSPTALTRQHTLLSFTRILQAGHAVSVYQPETVQAIFNRVVADRDVATGRLAGKDTVTKGRPDSWYLRTRIPSFLTTNECSLWNMGSSCSADQQMALYEGEARVDANWKVVVPAS